MDGVKKRYTETLHFFCFLATDLRIIRIYTELHGDFFEVDCVEKRCSEAFYFFDLKELK